MKPHNCGKTQYATYTQAQQVTRAMQRTNKLKGRDVRALHIYRCPECRTFHFTSNTNNLKKAA